MITASAAALCFPALALAQNAPVTGTAAGTPATGDVSASTTGAAQGTDDSVGVSGTADAQAADGGTARTTGSARFNQNMAMQRSTATANDDDERARSSSRSKASRNGADMSHSMSIYKERGEKPMVSREHEVTTPKEKALAADQQN
ncbi:hypothetical protein [Novosphingobium sp. M1R2S20]|uniref:Uncharacterized protein n=1 Tax=Novosphingobium rhizovicinum TaxID=3228928 RepID=A0ABV3RF46_9SPHN